MGKHCLLTKSSNINTNIGVKPLNLLQKYVCYAPYLLVL